MKIRLRGLNTKSIFCWFYTVGNNAQKDEKRCAIPQDF